MDIKTIIESALLVQAGLYFLKAGVFIGHKAGMDINGFSKSEKTYFGKFMWLPTPFEVIKFYKDIRSVIRLRESMRQNNYGDREVNRVSDLYYADLSDSKPKLLEDYLTEANPLMQKASEIHI